MFVLLEHEDKKTERERKKMLDKYVKATKNFVENKKKISVQSRTDWPLGAAKGLVDDV